MRDLLEATLGLPRRRDLLLDSNLLLLYVVGRTDRRLVRSFKRTRVFSTDDLNVLLVLVDAFDRLVTTPHVLTEVNGLTNALAEGHKPAVRSRLALDVPTWDERHVPGSGLVATAAFPGLGLTDAALATLSESPDGPLLMSTDGALVQFAAARGGAANHWDAVRHLLAQR